MTRNPAELAAPDPDAGKVGAGTDAIKAMVRYLIGYEVPLYVLEISVRKLYLREAIIATKGNQYHAAALVGIHRNTVARILTHEELKDAVEQGKQRKGV